MNDRIKALFIQAGGAIEEENGNLWTYSDDLDPEKFAQLIVRECVSIADEYDGVGSTIVSRIQKHFGVTE
jgi:hypothetical protein